MAKFTFSIATDDAGEMEALLSRFFGKGSDTADEPAVETPEPKATTTRKPRGPGKAQASTAGKESEPADETAPLPAEEPMAELPTDDAEEGEDEAVTREMVTQLGSKLMPKLRAAGIKAIIAEHGGGADTFGSIADQHLPAVYAAFKAADV